MKKKGFTLIELLAVIVVLAIIALIAIPMVLNTIEDARKGAAEASALNYINEVEKYMVISQFDGTKKKLEEGKTYQISEDTYQVQTEISLLSAELNEEEVIYLNHYIDMKGEKPKKGIVTIGTNNAVYSAEIVINDYIVLCDEKKCKVNDKLVQEEETEEQLGNTCENNVCEGESIIAIMNEITTLNTGYYTFKVNGVEETVEYPVHVIVYDGDQNWNETMTFGDEGDVSDGTNYAQNMVIVKVNGDLTVESSATIQPYYTEYGGPKGFFLYVTGTLTNDGTIDNSHGAYAQGENVYLWKNDDDTFEYVPAVGASGGIAKTSEGVGEAGTDGSNRQTGGGGGGALWPTGTNTQSGEGGNGTSYSGGSGGGGARGGMASNGSDEGGLGGNGSGNWNCSLLCSGNGGAGNSGGSGQANNTIYTTIGFAGSNGTGGLLIIYSHTFENNGTISANGSVGGYRKTGYDNHRTAGGGSSGGGSINIFYKEVNNINADGITHTGGSASNADVKGGAGGSGTATYLAI